MFFKTNMNTKTKFLGNDYIIHTFISFNLDTPLSLTLVLIWPVLLSQAKCSDLFCSSLWLQSVYKCDFLNLQLQQPLQLASDALDAFLRQLCGPIDALPAQLFHVVVFSLLLSYFPSPYQRWLCCKKAHELLTLNGLLLIITPDSSHQGRHALMMRSWRVAVESLGFKRYKYIKFSHMHLIAFRKVSPTTSSDLVSRNYPEMLYIPQDFNTLDEDGFADCFDSSRSDFEEDQLACSFAELPDTPYDSDSGESQSSSAPFHELEDPILLQSWTCLLPLLIFSTLPSCCQNCSAAFMYSTPF